MGNTKEKTSNYVGISMSTKLYDNLLSLSKDRELSIAAFIRQILIDYVNSKEPNIQR